MAAPLLQLAMQAQAGMACRQVVQAWACPHRQATRTTHPTCSAAAGALHQVATPSTPSSAGRGLQLQLWCGWAPVQHLPLCGATTWS